MSPGRALVAIVALASLGAAAAAAAQAPVFLPAAPVSAHASAKGFGVYKPPQPYSEQVATRTSSLR